MKILYVTTMSDTVNAFLIPHIKMLVDKGYKVDVAFSINQQVEESIYRMGCKVYDINFNRSPFKNNYRNLISIISNIIVEGDYDIVHTHTPIASAIIRIACKKIKNVKVVYTAHGFHFYKGAPLFNWLTFYPVEKVLAKYTDVLITINKEDYKRAHNFKPKQINYIPGVGIELDEILINKKKISYLKKELGISSDDFVLCSVGELNSNKNHKIVLEALSTLNNKNVKYLVVGEGELRDYLNKKVRELNLENQVIFLGYRNDINELLELSDVFVFPSIREGLPKALMEAMAMGKPAIVSDIRGNRDLIDHKLGGYLFNPTDFQQLCCYIDDILKNINDIQKMSLYNQNKIQFYSLTEILRKMSIIYEKLV